LIELKISSFCLKIIFVKKIDFIVRTITNPTTLLNQKFKTMSFPKTTDDLVAVGMAVQMTGEDHLGKPFKPNGDDDSYVLKASASARYGPFYDLIFGDFAGKSTFGGVFALRVRMNDGSEVTYGFRRLVDSPQWIWTEVKTGGAFDMNVVTASSCEELDNFINWAFRYFYAEVRPNDSLPWYFAENAKDSVVLPSLKEFDMKAELERERIQKEKEEADKAAEEERVRREAERVRREAERVRREKERQRLALQEEARRVSEERQQALRKAEEEAAAKLAALKALQAKQASTKDWFLRTMSGSGIEPQGLLKNQTSKLSNKDAKLFTEFLDDEQIGSGLIKNWWVEYCAQPQINF